MPSYELIRQYDLNGTTYNEVRLVADNGYSEVQTYAGSEDVLEDAQDHFNEEIMNQPSAIDLLVH